MRKAKTPIPTIIIGDGTLSKEKQERMALLIILHLGERQFAEGKFVPAADAFKRVRARLRRRQTKKR